MFFGGAGGSGVVACRRDSADSVDYVVISSHRCLLRGAAIFKGYAHCRQPPLGSNICGKCIKNCEHKLSKTDLGGCLEAI